MQYNPLFITGNQAKVAYLQSVLSIKLEHQQLSLDEVQSSSSYVVAEHKARQAYKIIGKPVLVEDAYLSFHALNGLPGPFIKFFYEAPDGLKMLCRMLDGFEDRSASTGTIYCFYDGAEIKTFNGKLNGSIAELPRGMHGFGWDMIFKPQGYDGRTLAELSRQEASELHKSIDAFRALRAFLDTGDRT